MGKNRKKHGRHFTKFTAVNNKNNLVNNEAQASETEHTECPNEEESEDKKGKKEKKVIYDMDACIFAFKLARDLKQNRYHAKTQSYIIENFDDAVREPNFYDEITKDDLIVFLQSDDLMVSCEEVVYHVVIRWIKHNREERLKYLDELLELVRFPQLELDFLGHQVLGERMILNSPVGPLLLHEAFQYHQNILDPKQRSST
ncbi:unnamed protein product [Clavelina lepadiformis]|uniref:BACK domain-containing protein n=1 Tax=Clavelina lepadiformis TaxID=159417 RepID=A0ABP0FA14_CLALP